MKKSKKIIFITIAIISLIVLFNINSYAVNNTANTSNTAKNNSSTSTDTISNKSKNENTQKTTSTTNKKSSNANLSNLGIKPNDFSGFKPTITTYNVTVSEDVEEINVYATAQDSKATVSGTGKKQLESGKNTVSVVVTAEDGTSKTYTININKSGNAKNNTKIDNQDGSKGLSELKIEGLTLEPEFSTNTYEYTTKYIGEDTKLNISAVATDSKFVVEVTGNEELKEGENIITILVSDSDGENVATYQADIEIYSNDRGGLLVDILKQVGTTKAKILGVNTKTTKEKIAIIEITLEVENTEELDKAQKAIRRVESVYEVRRKK